VLNPFDAVIVDETQDLGPQELRFLAALAGDSADCLTLVGDTGQRIYPNRTSLRDLGIDVRGRTRTLSLNYRTTEQIYRFAEAILGNEVDDLEGGRERRRTTYSLFAGPEPVTCGFKTPTEQYAFLAAEIERHCVRGRQPGEIAVLAQSRYSLAGAEAALKQAGIACHILGRDHAAPRDQVTLATIHRAKGMEFKVVFVIGASDDAVRRHLPSDADEQQMTLEQERNLLYVAVTRARDELIVCWTGKPSRFLVNVLPASA
jgi:superfamily I DNA/RNA helicase